MDNVYIINNDNNNVIWRNNNNVKSIMANQ